MSDDIAQTEPLVKTRIHIFHNANIIAFGCQPKITFALTFSFNNLYLSACSQMYSLLGEKKMFLVNINKT